MRRTAALFALLAVGAAPPPKAALTFVACPILRDTQSVPCWLTEYQGKTYYIGIQTDVSADLTTPMLGHRILVEGTPSNEPAICGGIPLKPVTVSVMADRADDCDRLIPADDYVLPFAPPRPPGPSRGTLAYVAPPPPVPVPPFQPKAFDVHYNFDEMVVFKSTRWIEPALNYARQIKARRIEIFGQQGVTRLTDGTRMAERPGLARDRAEQIADLLRGAGLTEPAYTVRWDDSARVGGPERRLVTIRIEP